jgi:DoxX-like family
MKGRHLTSHRIVYDSIPDRPRSTLPAALGVVAFFIGAVATHPRARVFYNIAFPIGYLALAVASLVVLL